MNTHAYLLPLATLLAIGCSPERRYERILSHVDSDSAQLTVIDASAGTWSGASGDDVTTEQAFLIGSNTKVLTAAVVLQLVEEGALSLEESASIWVPQLDPAITIRDLLQHTSGIGEYFDHDEMTAHDGAAMADEWRPEELIALGLEVRDDGPQATATYANTNYIALGLVVEAVEERSIGATLSERLFAPLGMTRSGLLLSGDPVPAHLVLGEGGPGGRSPGSTPRSAGPLGAPTPRPATWRASTTRCSRESCTAPSSSPPSATPSRPTSASTSLASRPPTASASWSSTWGGRWWSGTSARSRGSPRW